MNALENLPVCTIVCDRCGRGSERPGFRWLMTGLGCDVCVVRDSFELREVFLAARAIDRAAWTTPDEKRATQDRLTDALEKWDVCGREARREAESESTPEGGK